MDVTSIQGRAMAERDWIPRGPDAFEHLLVCAKLSEREAQAVRSVVLGMTAQEAAPLMGVSVSTVGSYRQRAYAKLSLTCKAEFLRLPTVLAWQEAMRAEEEEQPVNRPETAPDLTQDDSELSCAEVIQSLLLVFMAIGFLLLVACVIGLLGQAGRV